MRKYFKRLSAVVMTAMLTVTSFTVMPQKMFAASVAFTNVGGWNESIYAQISGVQDADVTGVSYSGTTSGSLTGDDLKYLVRDNNGGVRLDIPGVKPGTYTLKVTTTSGEISKSDIVVDAYDRSGYAHFNYTQGVGAYKDDGTLKDNAIVLYVTEENKNTVTVKSKDGTTVSGIGNILNSVGKESSEKPGYCKRTSGGKTYWGIANSNKGIIEKLAKDGTPLVVRIVGNVTAPEGLTAFNAWDYGGSVGDNGFMARMQSGKDITIEGIGYDATVNGWGFHFMCGTDNPTLGKSFEVRNVVFRNVPEDCIGMEGVQEGSNITASVERCWIHNCEFYVPHISNPAESDKAEGDGACDFKRGQYFTNSYCYYEGYHKTNLVGSSDSSLQYHLSYHHNYWKNCESRGPLGRQANMHFYNNVYENQISYAMNTRANAYIFSEYNLFYMAKSPQDVASGAIKSYHDSFSSCINEMGGTIVTDKNQPVASGNKYENFDANPQLSYIPSGNYQLQESVTEARKVIYSKTGVMKENPVAVKDVTMSMISYVPSGVTPEVITTFPYTVSNQKFTKTVKAFTVNGKVDVTVSYADAAKSGILVNEAGEALLTGDGTIRGLEAGTYMIQPINFQPGTASTPGTFKEFNIASLEITPNDPNAHFHDYKVTNTVEATCTVNGSKTYKCDGCGDTYTEVIAAGHKYSLSWTIDVEPTETTPGSKSRHCTVCDAKTDITEIPAGSSGDIGGDIGAGEYAHNFTESGTTSKIYTITGNLSTGKGTVSYGGLQLTQCLKMESSTNIKFIAPSDGKLTLVFGGSTSAAGKAVNVNGTKYTCDGNGIAEIDISAGTVEIKKADSINLFYMNFESSSTPDPDPKPDNPDPVEGKLGDVNEDGTVDIQDAVLLKKHAAQMAVTINEKNADVDKDGKITSTDIVLILKKCAGIDVGF